ncbi:MAG: DUF1549 and DUF1553 domain-containing protein [Verrucomicrobiota bacterium]
MRFFLVVLLVLVVGRVPAEEPLWSLQPLTATVHDSVDGYVNERLAKKGLKAVDRADAATLLRRVALTLTGIQPSVAEIERLAQADYSEVVDYYLNSPHYGERWGRHWLDLARYVQGTIKVPGIDEIDMAIPYRDYVVRSFNSDKPYDQFLTEQLAGDLMPREGISEQQHLDQIIAPAFLAIGPWFDECTDPNKLRLDIIDEQIATLSKAFLGMDFACSRCHDHKFDPIPTADYYVLAGILKSTEITSKFSEFWRDGRPRMVVPLESNEQAKARAKIEEQRRSLQRERWLELNRLRSEFIEKNADLGELSQTELAGSLQIIGKEAEDYVGQKNVKIVEGKYTPAVKTRQAWEQWIDYRLSLPQGGEHYLYLRYANDADCQIACTINGIKTQEPLQTRPTGGREYQNYRWEKFGPFVFNKGQNRLRFDLPRHQFLPLLDALKIVRVGDSIAQNPREVMIERIKHSRTFWPPMPAEMEIILAEQELVKLAEIDQSLAGLPELQIDSALSAKAVSPANLPVHVGGDTYQTEGEPLARAVPSLVAALADDYPIGEQSNGRLELAAWMSDKRHPLTARVMVNRIWAWHFGKGLVTTLDDFGGQGALPSHPGLLDWLASELITSGWSIKHIHQLILGSEAFQRAGGASGGDPDGIWLSHYAGYRLEAEAIYDTMLFASDKIQRQSSGQPLDLARSKDRAMYILTSGRSPKGLGLEIRKMFPLFGFDTSGRPMYDRPDASTPNQALWFLNNSVPHHYAEKTAEHLKDADMARVFQQVLGRSAAPAEKSAADAYLESSLQQGQSRQEALAKVILGLFSTEEFLWVR